MYPHPSYYYVYCRALSFDYDHHLGGAAATAGCTKEEIDALTVRGFILIVNSVSFIGKVGVCLLVKMPTTIVSTPARGDPKRFLVKIEKKGI